MSGPSTNHHNNGACLTRHACATALRPLQQAYLITVPMLAAWSGDSLCHPDRTLDSSRLAQKNVTSGRSEGSSSCRHASQAAAVWEKELSHALARARSSPAEPYREQTAWRRLAASAIREQAPTLPASAVIRSSCAVFIWRSHGLVVCLHCKTVELCGCKLGGRLGGVLALVASWEGE